jgi:hypothetical protein
MRGKAETDRKTNRGESSISGSQQQFPIDQPYTLEYLKQLEREIFGPVFDSTASDSTVSDSIDLSWSMVRSDNYMVRTLKQAVTTMAHVLVEQVKQVEKDIKRAKRVFYG